MPLKPAAFALATAIAFAATTAAGAETSVALLAGYAGEIRMVGNGGVTAYGFGLGMRAGVAYCSGAYVGGTLVTHFGTLSRAEDVTHRSIYRAAYHDAYVGPELGWELRADWFVMRPYVAAGALYQFGRTSVRDHEVREDHASPFVMPGVATMVRIGAWEAGVDLRMPFATELPAIDWAPSFFVLVGLRWSP